MTRSALVAKDGGDRVEFARSLTIGRHPASDLVLAEARVSGHHAAIDWDGAAWRLKDLGSRNGTTVNGKRLRTSRVLKPGDVLRFGGVSSWRVETLGAPQATEAAIAWLEMASSARRTPIRSDRFLLGTAPPCDLVVPEWAEVAGPVRAIVYMEAGELLLEPAGVPGITVAGAVTAGPVSLDGPVELTLGETRLRLIPGSDPDLLGATETAGHRSKVYELELELVRTGPGEGTIGVRQDSGSWSISTGQRFMLLYLLGRRGGGWMDDGDLRRELWGRTGARDMDPSALHKLIHDARHLFLGRGVDGWFIEKSSGRTRLRLRPDQIRVRDELG